MQDTIHLKISKEEVLVNDTVKVVATIAALITPGTSDPEMRRTLRETMNRLIPDAEWQFSNMSRHTDATGIECLTVTASTRVSERENSNLEGRAREVSRPGIAITSVQVDTGIPQTMLDTAAQKLRIAILTEAQDEARRVNAVLNQPDYHVHRVQFQSGAADASNRHMKGMAMATTYGSGFSDDSDDTLGNAQKLILSADIVLATRHPNAD